MSRVRHGARPLLALSLAAVVAACGGGGGGTAAPASPLKVTGTDPVDGAQGVALDKVMRVAFSIALDPSTVNGSTIRVGRYGGLGEAYGTVQIDPASSGTALVFTPTTALDPMVTYAILVASTLRSAAGDPLGGQTTFLFGTTIGTLLPVQSQLQPANQSLRVGRRNHTATLLKNSTVLITGGFIQGTQIGDSAEIFEPAGGSFTKLGNHMAQERAGHTATLLPDGRVLLAGGWHVPAVGVDATSKTAEIYSPAGDTFTAVGDMSTDRVDHAALLLPNGNVLVTGGSRLVGTTLEDLSDAEVFDSGTNTWSAWPHAMAHTRATHVMRDLGDGRFLLVGGSDVDLRPEIFSTTTGLFTTLPIPASELARFGPAGAPFSDGDVCVAGGDSLGSVLHFDRQATTILNSGSGLGRSRAYATASQIGPGRVLVVGGIDFGAGSLILSSCDLVVQGGLAGSHTYVTQLAFPTPMANHTATVLPDGRVMFCGGLNPVSGLAEYDGAYIFTP